MSARAYSLVACMLGASLVQCTSPEPAKASEPAVDAGTVTSPDAGTCLCDDQSEKLVFMTSTTTDGNTGGIAGADAICNARAAAADLPGTYKAWLAIAGSSPASTFTQSTVPYKLVTGKLVANDWADLVDGTLANPIDRDELGLLLINQHSWTATDPSGASASSNCEGWQTNSAMSSGAQGRNFATSTGDDWTNETAPSPCDVPNHLYCFQQ